MKALLLCPGNRPPVPALSLDQPLAAIPLLGQPLAATWIERLALLGARDIRVLAPDRGDALRAALGDGGRWGVKLEVIDLASEITAADARASFGPAGEPGWLAAPYDVVTLDRLPGGSGQPLFESYAAWFAAVVAWMPHALTPARLRVVEVKPGVWVGRRAQIAPSARLVAPCWVGDLAYVGAGAVIGPSAVLEDRSVVERNARVVSSIVGADTFVGRMTSISHSLALGSILTNWRSGSSLRVPDPFLMCSLVRGRKAARDGAARPSLASSAGYWRAAAAVAALVASFWTRWDGSSPSLKPPA